MSRVVRKTREWWYVCSGVLIFANKAWIPCLTSCKGLLHTGHAQGRPLAGESNFNMLRKKQPGGLYLEYDSQQWTGGAWGLTLAYFVPEFWAVCEDGAVKLLGKTGGEKGLFLLGTTWDTVFWSSTYEREKKLMSPVFLQSTVIHRLFILIVTGNEVFMLKIHHWYGDIVHEGQTWGGLTSLIMVWNLHLSSINCHLWDSRECPNFRVVHGFASWNFSTKLKSLWMKSR